MRREPKARIPSTDTLASKQQLWLDLTKELANSKGFPIDNQISGLRASINDYNSRVARDLTAKSDTKWRCAETGDGHFLRHGWSNNCESMLIVDKFDSHADIKLDLDLPPNQAPEEIKAAHGTIDLLVSHQVFEHLARPSIGMANLNAL